MKNCAGRGPSCIGSIARLHETVEKTQRVFKVKCVCGCVCHSMQLDRLSCKRGSVSRTANYDEQLSIKMLSESS